MRARSRRVSAAKVKAFGASAIAVFSFFYAANAYAGECSNPLINTCINSDTYWPNAGPMRFAAVGGTETVGRGQVAFGLVTTYLSRPILLKVASPGPGGSEQFVVDHQVNGNFLFAYGVTDRLELDFGLPLTFVQTGAGISPLTGGRDLRDTAVRDLRFGFTYALVPRLRVDPLAPSADEMNAGRLYSIAARFITTAPTGDSTDFAGERTAVFAPSITGDLRFGRIFAGADVGARVRPVTEFAGGRVGTQFTTALGAGFDVLDRERLAITLEGRAYWQAVEQHDTQQSAFGITSTPNGQRITPAEWLLGVRSAPLLGGDISFFAGGGGPIPLSDAAITVPRFRFVLGVMYAPVLRDTDGDGVPDKNDICPDRAGNRGGDRPGCPGQTQEKRP